MPDDLLPLLRYFPNLAEKQLHCLTQLGSLYYAWNKKINLISRKDIEHLYERHILHSMAIAKVIQFKPGTTVLDVGTGGGFPGIPLAVYFPDCRFHLVDSMRKKTDAVNDIISQLGLTNTTAEQVRAEQLKTQYDFITGRAVTELPVFYKWVRHLIIPGGINTLRNGILYLKGGDIREEMKNLIAPLPKAFPIRDYFQEEYFETKNVVYLSA